MVTFQMVRVTYKLSAKFHMEVLVEKEKKGQRLLTY